jgi:hypothetical protein
MEVTVCLDRSLPLVVVVAGPGTDMQAAPADQAVVVVQHQTEQDQTATLDQTIVVIKI